MFPIDVKEKKRANDENSSNFFFFLTQPYFVYFINPFFSFFSLLSSFLTFKLHQAF